MPPMVGMLLTVTACVRVQPEALVYVIVALPLVRPVTTPPEVIVTLPVPFVLDQLPPEGAPVSDIDAF